MNLLLLFFSGIALINAKAISLDDAADDDTTLSYDVKSEEQREESGQVEESDVTGQTSHSTGVFTKYPDDPDDEYVPVSGYDIPLELYVSKRAADFKDTESGVDHQPESELRRPERKAVEPKIHLRGFISAVESDLVGRAQSIIGKLRKRRSLFDQNHKSDDNITRNDNSDDINKNFFGDLFNYTRPQRESGEARDRKIPLNGIVQAIESTLINTAENLRDPAIRNVKRDTESVGVGSAGGVTDQKSDDQNASDEKEEEGNENPPEEVKVQKLAPANNPHHLGLLDAIAAKVKRTERDTAGSDEQEVNPTTNLPPIHQTNLTVVQSSDTVDLIPDAEKKLAYVQRQQIQKTVFHTNLAIFPTISPKAINHPLFQTTTAIEEVNETTTKSSGAAADHEEEPERKHQLLDKAIKLKEKIAEVRANPVIFSQI